MSSRVIKDSESSSNVETSCAQPNRRVLLCCTGSVASIKIPQLAAELQQRHLDVRLVSTSCALHFFSRDQLPPSLQPHLFTDADEWSSWRCRGDPVMHIELTRWADLLLLAPLSANSLAKLSHGLADNLVTCVARAWPVCDKPAVVCPAMNTRMWQHPCTEPQLSTLREWGYTVVPPVEKQLVCGDVGVGAMASLEDICCHVVSVLEQVGSPRSTQQL